MKASVKLAINFILIIISPNKMEIKNWNIVDPFMKYQTIPSNVIVSVNVQIIQLRLLNYDDQ